MKKSISGAMTLFIGAGAYVVFKSDIIGVCVLINLICECLFIYLDYFDKDDK